MLLKFNAFTIRSAVLDDAKQLEIWWNDGAVMAHAGFPLGIGETAEDIAEKLKNDTDDDRRLMMEHNGVPIGEMCYRRKNGDTAEIGIKICDFSQHVYEELGFRKVRVLENSWRNQLGQLQSQIDYEMYRKDFVNFAR